MKLAPLALFISVLALGFAAASWADAWQFKKLDGYSQCLSRQSSEAHSPAEYRALVRGNCKR